MKTVGQVYTFLGCRSLASVRRTLLLELGTHDDPTRMTRLRRNLTKQTKRGHERYSVAAQAASSFLHNDVLYNIFFKIILMMKMQAPVHTTSRS